MHVVRVIDEVEEEWTVQQFLVWCDGIEGEVVTQHGTLDGFKSRRFT